MDKDSIVLSPTDEEDNPENNNNSELLNTTNLISNTLGNEKNSRQDQMTQKSRLGNPSMNSLDSIMSSSSTQFDNNSLSIPMSGTDFYFNQNDMNCSSPMYRSITSIPNEEDPWRASSIGIKCISYKPIGYIFLTRRVLDLYTTDGQRKVDIVYNYSKKYRNRIKTPSIGSSINNCSFCDTITIDFDPSSTLFDLIMEVQIITQGNEFNFFYRRLVKSNE